MRLEVTWTNTSPGVLEILGSGLSVEHQEGVKYAGFHEGVMIEGPSSVLGYVQLQVKDHYSNLVEVGLLVHNPETGDARRS